MNRDLTKGTIAVSTNVSRTWDLSTLEDYPCSDGEPMAENTTQYRWIALIKNGLDLLFAADHNVFVAADLFWYAVPGKNPIRVAPDVMVVLGRPKGDRLSYLQWVEEGVAPQVVFEILSPGNRRLEMERKFRFYNRYGAEEYYLYAPEAGKLTGFIRGSSGLEPIPKMKGFQSPRLGITFHPRPGPENLVIKGPDGARFISYSEAVAERDIKARLARKYQRSALTAIRQAEKQALVAERERKRAREQERQAEFERQRAAEQEQLAQAERERADAKEQLAQAERERADEQTRLAEKLVAKLRELGVEPD